MERIESGSYDVDDSFYNYRFEQIILKTDSRGTYDFENAKIIYELFEDITVCLLSKKTDMYSILNIRCLKSEHKNVCKHNGKAKCCLNSQ